MTLVAGFRPEHLEASQPAGPSGTLRARTDVVEFLGNEELLHVNAAEQDIVAIVGSEHRVRPATSSTSPPLENGSTSSTARAG